MHIIVVADIAQKKIFLSKKINTKVTFEFLNENEQQLLPEADALFILNNKSHAHFIMSAKAIPVFLNSVIITLENLPSNVHRINAWPTFLERDIWEVATNNKVIVNEVFQKIGWQYILTPDEPGFIAARIITMIINEAYFALEDGVSSKAEIDTAMRLGTNYPYGPFEWATKIGINNIISLLAALAASDKRYTASRALINEATA